MVSILIGKFVTLSAVVLIEALFVRETASDCDAASWNEAIQRAAGRGAVCSRNRKRLRSGLAKWVGIFLGVLCGGRRRRTRV